MNLSCYGERIKCKYIYCSICVKPAYGFQFHLLHLLATIIMCNSSNDSPTITIHKLSLCVNALCIPKNHHFVFICKLKFKFSKYLCFSCCCVVFRDVLIQKKKMRYGTVLERCGNAFKWNNRWTNHWSHL